MYQLARRGDIRHHRGVQPGPTVPVRPSSANDSSQGSAPSDGNTGANTAPGPSRDNWCPGNQSRLRQRGVDQLVIGPELRAERGGHVPGVDHCIQKLESHHHGNRPTALVRPSRRHRWIGRSGSQWSATRRRSVRQRETSDARRRLPARPRCQRRRRNRGSGRYSAPTGFRDPMPCTAWAASGPADPRSR